MSLYQDDDTPIPDELQTLGARVLKFPAPKLFTPQRLWHLTRFLGREHVDVLHTHLTYANIVGTITARLPRVPVVATLHNTQIERRDYHPIRQGLETWLLRYGAQRVVAVGHAVAEVNQSRFGSKPIDVIPNAVAVAPAISAAERTALRTELAGDPFRPLLISVGRLVAPKGFPDLLAAVAALRETHPAAALIIAGGGGLYAELTAQIAARKLEGHVVLLGERNDVPRLLAASDLYVSASLSEGLPIAVLEAMAAGLPVVATSVGDIPKVVVDGTGLLVPVRDPNQLVIALRSMLDNPERMRSCGLAAQAHVTHHNSSTAWVNQLLALYTEVCAASGTASQRQKEVRCPR